MLVVGLDAASQWKNFGYALGDFDGQRITITVGGIVQQSKNSSALEQIVAPRLAGAGKALVAIDAPLGWPRHMGKSLLAHRAGQPLDQSKDDLFRRTTDKVVQAMTGKTPLEIGADRIARAAHSALEAVELLRRLSGKPLVLATSPAVSSVELIEVYPAATLKARELRSSGYKDDDGKSVRAKIVLGLKDAVVGLDKFMNGDINVFDACLCLVAARDFLLGICRKPRLDEESDAAKEGWIWVMEPFPSPRGNVQLG